MVEWTSLKSLSIWLRVFFFFLISTVSTTDGPKNEALKGKKRKRGRKIDFQRGALLLSWIGQVVTVTVLYTDRRRFSKQAKGPRKKVFEYGKTREERAICNWQNEFDLDDLFALGQLLLKRTKSTSVISTFSLKWRKREEKNCNRCLWITYQCVTFINWSLLLKQ